MIILSLVGCHQGERLNAESLIVENLNEINDSKINEYNIEVELNTEDMTYKGKQTVSYTNNTDADLKDIYFHVYPNAFKRLHDAPVLFDTFYKMDTASYVPGYIDIEKVMEGDKDLKWNIDEDKETILHIELNNPLEKGKEMELYLEYTVKLPSTEDRFGYHDKGINLGNWYPVLAVYDENGWNLDPYYSVGDPFYSEVSNYDVSIAVPKGFEVATSGNILSETEEGSKRIYKIEGKLIRDFAWVASKDFEVKEKMVDDTVVKVYSIKNNSQLLNNALDVGEKSIKTFNKVFGKYPYGQYSIVITKFPSGMEYPGIVFISDEYYPSTGPLEIVIVHETAHQWWYGVVGNNQVKEAWLDEGLTTYSEVIYMKEIYGDERGKLYYENNIKLGYEYASQYIGEDKAVNKPLSEFEGWNDYGPLAYSRAAMLVGKINEDFGEEVLYDILKKYYEKYQFRIAKTEDFIGICEEVTNTSFDSLVKEYLNDNK